MPDSQQTVRIFISSPGDVAEEREGARRVVEGLRHLYPGAQLQTLLWEELALPATASFQETIDILLDQEPIDIAVFILWSRLGSPLGAAVTRADGSPYRSGTEREFDLMLAAFEQSGRKGPIILAYVRDDYEGFTRRLGEIPKTELAETVAQRALVESFIVEHFHDSEGRNLRAYQTYQEPIGFTQRLRVHLRRSLDDLLQVESTATWEGEPYRGLQTFDIEHAPIFHGRDEETCDLLQRLRDQEQSGCAFVVIVAASGAGKSSLARAGVAANLVQSTGVDENVRWHVASFIPTLAERGLFDALVGSLCEALPELADSAESRQEIAEGLQENARLTVKLSIVPRFKAFDKPIRLLLILDQMEELWTDRNTTKEDRESFLTAVAALAESGYVSILATLRSDFYPHAQQSPTFLKLKGERGHFDLLPPDSASIQRLITEPARLAGVAFERDEKTAKSLDQVIWDDASTDTDALPLLEYTLAELYRQRDEQRGVMTFASYVELGGVEGAIGKRADETFARLPADAQAALDEILPLLVSVDTAGEQSGVRRRATVADLTSTPARKTLTDTLITERFLTTDREGETPVASLAHEALLRSWNRIVSWINTNRENLRLRARVEQQQQRWEQQDRDESLLLAEGLPLDEGRQLTEEASYLLSDSTSDYIQASISHYLHRTRKTRRLKAMVTSVVVALLAIITAGAFVTRRQRQREVTQSLVTAVTTARGIAFPPTVDDLDALPRRMVLDELVTRFESPEESGKLRLAFALARYGDIRVDYLLSQISRASPDEFNNFFTALRDAKTTSIAEIKKQFSAVLGDSESHLRMQARLALLACYLGDFSLAEEICKERTKPHARTVFIAEVSTLVDEFTKIKAIATRTDDVMLRSTLCLIVGATATDRFTPTELIGCQSLLGDWHRGFPDTATHSATGWALRNWGLPTAKPSDNLEGRQWHVNQMGLTMMRIPAGEFLNNAGDTVDVEGDFHISDMEVSIGSFQQFLDEVTNDPRYPDVEKPDHWTGFNRVGEASNRTEEHPAEGVSWNDAVKFCNWLSRKEGRTVVYRRVMYRGRNPHDFDMNELDFTESRLATLPKGIDRAIELEIRKNQLLFQLGRYEDSLAGFEALLDSGVNQAKVHLYRAIMRARLGDSVPARESLERFLTFASEENTALTRAYASMIVDSWLGDGALALRRLKEVVELHNPGLDFLYTAASACSLSLVAAAHHEDQELEAELKLVAIGLLQQAKNTSLDLDLWVGANSDFDSLRTDADFVQMFPNARDGKDGWVTDSSSEGYRLPNADEWEYACRAGATTMFSCGDNAKWLPDYVVMSSKSSARCGSRMPNAWGLFDMHGNVSEWCDEMHMLHMLHEYRIIRGGSWNSSIRKCNASEDLTSDRSFRFGSTGFRVVFSGVSPAG